MQVCKVEKDFGKAKSQILHVFDPKVEAQNGHPASSLARYLEKQLGELLPMLGVKPISVSLSLNLWIPTTLSSHCRSDQEAIGMRDHMYLNMLLKVLKAGESLTSHNCKCTPYV